MGLSNIAPITRTRALVVAEKDRSLYAFEMEVELTLEEQTSEKVK